MASQLKLKINVVKLAKQAAGSNPAKQDAYISALSDGVKREFGKRCIDFILERTNDGKDKNNSPFVKYSAAYKKSLPFKIYGKSSTVNLKLTGAMQAAIDVTDVSDTTITLGFVDQFENDKAHGHVNGSNNLPVRDFWGIPEKDQQRILKDTIREFEDLESFAIVQDVPVQSEVGTQELDIFFGGIEGEF